MTRQKNCGGCIVLTRAVTIFQSRSCCFHFRCQSRCNALHCDSRRFERKSSIKETKAIIRAHGNLFVEFVLSAIRVASIVQSARVYGFQFQHFRKFGNRPVIPARATVGEATILIRIGISRTQSDGRVKIRNSQAVFYFLRYIVPGL